MSSIRVEDGYLALFNIFHTYGPEGQQRLFDTWRGLPPADTQPGLVAGNFHRSFDGRSVINYAQWESSEHYDAFMSEAGTRGRLGEALSFSRMDSMTCEVTHTSDLAPALSVEQPWFTEVLVVTTNPRDQSLVLKEMTGDDPGLAEAPGHVSHAVHRGISGTHVIKYSQWSDEESYRAFTSGSRSSSLPDTSATAELYFSRLEYVRGRS
jgi:heme-degrading monooxygenase HmoA